VEFLRVIDRRKNCTIANNDLFASNVGLVEVLARKRTRQGGQEKNEVLDWNNDVWILMVIVTFLDIRREEMVTKLVRRHGSWLSNGSKFSREHRRETGRSGDGAGKWSGGENRTQSRHTTSLLGS
jgi:hypothetical protein